MVEQKEIASGIFDLCLHVPEAAAEAHPGQFADLFCRDGSRLLPRPISIAGIDREKGTLRLVYRISGAGTAAFSGLHSGEAIDLIGPLGNGYPLDEARGRKVWLIGGGIGIPPLLETAKELSQSGVCSKITSVLGYRDKNLFLADEFEAFGEVLPATEDGSAGTKGTVLDVLKRCIPDQDSILFACGPTPMLRALQTFAAEQDLSCWLSLEERMACGIGACLACVCRTSETDDHSKVKNARVCKDGPVFRAEDVVL